MIGDAFRAIDLRGRRWFARTDVVLHLQSFGLDPREAARAVAPALKRLAVAGDTIIIRGEELAVLRRAGATRATSLQLIAEDAVASLEHDAISACRRRQQPGVVVDPLGAAKAHLDRDGTSCPGHRLLRAALDAAQAGLGPCEDLSLCAATAVRHCERLCRSKPDMVAISERGLSSASWIYVVQAAPDGPVKIGVATMLEGRLRGLCYSSPVPLRFVGARRGYRATEALLHLLFDPWRMHGEWFSPFPALLAAARSICTLFSSREAGAALAWPDRAVRLRAEARGYPSGAEVETCHAGRHAGGARTGIPSSPCAEGGENA